MADRVSTLQEQLYAEGRKGGTRACCSCCRGWTRRARAAPCATSSGSATPRLHIATFGRPTPEELEHDFLWRIRNQLPKPGKLGVFDRSHYEDVLAARVRGIAERRVWGRRYRTINRFEEQLAASGTRVVKCFLHISAEEQRARLLARLDDPTKLWKYNPGDLEDRALWGDYMAAYADALERCSTEAAPWYIVPADRKWYRNWAITQLLIEQLEDMALAWPAADFDADEERRRLKAIP